MKRAKLMFTALLAAFAVSAVNAQESVIIRKNKDSKEKTTVVIEGDHITVNGKDIKDYKGDEIEVVKSLEALRGRAMTLPRIASRGGAQSFGGDNFWVTTGSNSAVLGVNTEKTDDGAKVTSVTKESGAEKAGLKEGDVITKVGDKTIEDSDDLYETIGKYKPEDKVSVTYKRDGKSATTTATLGKNKSTTSVWSSQGLAPSVTFDNVGQSFYFPRRPRVGIQIQDTEDESGVKVLDVSENTAADKAGLKEGDIITEANGKAVKNLSDIREEMKELKEGDTLKLKYKRGGTVQSADLKFPKRLEKANF